jgi:nonribosomal peptide synthetase MxcG
MSRRSEPSSASEHSASENCPPLTEAELGLWLGQQAANDPSIYLAAQFLIFDGPLDRDAFVCALDKTMRESESLQVRFVERQGVPLREPIAYRGPCLTQLELPESPNVNAQLQAHGRKAVLKPFDIAAGELYAHQLVRLADGRHAWLQIAHHVALDGYGFNLIARRVAEHYTALTGGIAAKTARFSSMDQVTEADRNYQVSSERELDRQFWLAELEGIHGAQIGARSILPTTGLHVTRLLPRPLADRLRASTGSLNVAWTELVLASIAQLVHARTGASSFSLGLPVMLRLGTPAVRVPCMAMNITALPVHCRPGASLLSLAQQLKDSLLRQKRHQRYRYEHLKTERRLAGGALFGPLVNLMPFDLSPSFGSCSAQLLDISAGPVEDLSFALSPRAGSLELLVDAHPASFSLVEVETLADQLLSALEDGLADPERAMSPKRSLPEVPASLAERIQERVRTRPLETALIAAERSWSYAELDAAARAAASEFARCGLRPGRLVALDLPRTADALIAILATLYLGAGYAALDPKHPLARRQQILNELEPFLLLNLPAAPEALEVPAATRRCTTWGTVHESTEATERFAGPPGTHAAYVVFTSGSTGEAKGVVVSHLALAHFVDAASSIYEFTTEDRVLQFAPLAFDASVEELFLTWTAGATLVLRDDTWLDSLHAFCSACERERISVLDLPTAFWHELTLALEAGSASLWPNLRLVIIGGEAALPGRLGAWQRLAPQVRLLNTYGPAEATVVATVSDLSGWKTGSEVPIGLPLPGVDALLVDDQGQLIETIESSGELYLAGPTLSSGYFRRPDLTRQRFLSLPGFARAYRTGDRVTRAADGRLTFVGRVDDELKISGYRVAPAEVEAVLSKHPLVRTCAVLAESGGAGKHLVAHVEADAEGVTAAELRQFMLESLPAAMAPSLFEIHAELPRSSNGKLDRALLRRAAAPSEPAVLLSSREQRVVSAWKEVLNLAQVGIDDNFFSLGGSSLQVIQLANRLSQSDAVLSVAAIFRNPTPRKQAELLSEFNPLDAHRAFTPLSTPLDDLGFPPPRFVARCERRVLLTGATGFVGVHLLERLLEEADCFVVCAVRAPDAPSARQRLLDHARDHGVPLEHASARWQAIPLDLLAAGGAKAWAEVLGDPCAWIVHCAAQVSLTRDYESLYPSNVLATRNLIHLACRWGSELHHVSTVATAHLSNGKAVPERFFPRHEGLADGYQQSKWQAEQLCAEAGARGLPTAVYRLGRITGAQRRPRINGADLVWRIARSASGLGAWPELGVEEPWLPADVTADTLVRLALAGSAQAPAESYHLVQSGSVQLGRIRAGLVALGVELAPLPLGEWLERLRASHDDDDRATLAFFELHGLSGRANAALEARAAWSFASVRARIPDLDTSPISDSLIASYCRSAIELGIVSPVPRHLR